jgi:hypothetical protein
MTNNDLSRFAALSNSSLSAVTGDDDFLRISIAYHLRNFCLEVGTMSGLQTAANARKISGAIFFSLEPRQFRLLIADARTSIVLALQRHLGDAQYRRRLRTEAHFRALRPHLSANFRVLMMPPSNWAGYRFSEVRKPSLILAYQSEIERLEMDLAMSPE